MFKRFLILAFLLICGSSQAQWNNCKEGFCSSASGAAVVSSFWNTSDSTGNYSLSNINLTATATNGVTGAIRSNISKNSGLLYVELTLGSTVSGGNTSVGIATSTAVLTQIGPTADHAFVIFISGNIWFNGASTGINAGALSANSVVGLALDTVHSTAYFRVNNGNWNGNVSANPVTNTGGINVSALFPTNGAFLVTSANFTGVSATINSTGPFVNTPPAGFSAWN